MKRTAVYWVFLTALFLGIMTGCAPDGTSNDATGKSAPSGKTSGPAQPKPPKEDPG
jgi:hypothetical protein